MPGSMDPGRATEKEKERETERERETESRERESGRKSERYFTGIEDKRWWKACAGAREPPRGSKETTVASGRGIWDRAADAAVDDLDELLVGPLRQDLLVHAHLAELIFDDGEAQLVVRVVEDVVEQRRLAGAQESGQDRHGDALVLASGDHSFGHCVLRKEKGQKGQCHPPPLHSARITGRTQSEQSPERGADNHRFRQVGHEGTGAEGRETQPCGWDGNEEGLTDDPQRIGRRTT